MALVFSDFYKLDQLAQLRLGGSFSISWDGTYLPTRNGKIPNPGSGLSSGNLPMKDENSLPTPIQALLEDRGLIYIFISTKYPILYVGITENNLKEGFFGPGRISHHARKLLAALGGGTSHTGGWTDHAVQRYRDFVKLIAQGDATLERTAFHLCDDWRFAFASCRFPKKHEGFVLDQVAPLLSNFWGNVIILNSNPDSLKRDHVEIKLPQNLDTVVAQSAPQEKAPIREADELKLPKNQATVAVQSATQEKVLMQDTRMSNELPLSCGVIRAVISARLAYEFEADSSAILTVKGEGRIVLLEKSFSNCSLDVLVEWSLSYGAEIEILEPLQLRQQVANRVKFAVDCFYGSHETGDRMAVAPDVYTPSGMSSEDALHATIEKKLSARRDLRSKDEVPDSEPLIKLWIDTRRLNPFDNTPLSEGSVRVDYLTTQNKEILSGLFFEGEWFKRTGWVLSCCDSVCVLSPESYRREITEIINIIDKKYSP